MQQRNLFVEDLGQHVDSNVFLSSFAKLDILLAESLILGLVQHDLRENLVGEGAGHDERGMASGTAKVDETAFG
jgi:hypothetical protein